MCCHVTIFPSGVGLMIVGVNTNTFGFISLALCNMMGVPFFRGDRKFACHNSGNCNFFVAVIFFVERNLPLGIDASSTFHEMPPGCSMSNFCYTPAEAKIPWQQGSIATRIVFC